MVRTDPEAKAYFERIEGFYRQAPQATRTNLLLAALTFAVMWGQADPVLLWGWAAAVVAMHAFRMAVWLGFRRDAGRAERATLWARRCAWAMLASGVVWGAGGYLMFPEDNALLQAYWLVVSVGIAAGVTTANAFLPLAHDAYVVPLLAPLIVKCVALGGFTHYAIAAGMTLYLVFALRQARHQAALLAESFRRRHENLALLEELRAETARANAAQREAEHANLAKSRFFAAASHDLRQPLHALGLLAHSLRDRPAIAQDGAKGVVGNMLQSVDALESLFDELLDIARIDAGAIVAQPVDVALQATFGRLRASYAPLAEAKGLVLRLRPTLLAVHCDPVLLDRALGNLAANAIRYTRHGGVLVAARRRRGRIALEVWDTGIGIAPDHRERVFEEFYQVDNPERDRARGLGLGLATLKRIAPLMRATLSLESRPARGSVFRLDLPEGDPARAMTLPVPADPADGLAGRRVLVADDEAAVRAAMRALLEEWGCLVETADCADDAARVARPDAILADYRLRGGATGLDFVRRVRERHGANVPAAIITGDLGEDSRQAIAAAGLPLLSKPAKPLRLRALLSALFAS